MFINQVLFHYENVSSFLFDFLGCNIVSQLSKCLNPIGPGLFSRSPGPGGLRGPDGKNQG